MFGDLVEQISCTVIGKKLASSIDIYLTLWSQIAKDVGRAFPVPASFCAAWTHFK